jgi:hypothetical protein
MAKISALERKIEREYNNYNDLNPINKFNLTDEQNYLLKKLGSFEAPYLEEKLLSDEKFKTREKYEEAFSEFKKYVALSKICGDDITITMTSKEVDEVWHQFILFTPQYHQFCKEILGKYFHHIPKTSLTPLDPKGKENFIESYKKVFGEIPEIWGLLKNNQRANCSQTNCCGRCK